MDNRKLIQSLRAASEQKGKAIAQLAELVDELKEALQELADFSVDDSSYRYTDRSKEARRKAYDLLKRLEGET